MTHSLDAPPHILCALEHLATWLSEAGAAIGLTNYCDSRAVLYHAIGPALALPRLLRNQLVGPWAEFGPASGAIGLTLALVSPAAHLDLLDRRQRVTAFLDLSVQRFSIANAAAQTADIAPGSGLAPWFGVCFRALAEPRTALAIAAPHARRWICAWHSRGLPAYDQPPRGFACVARCGTSSPNLLATLYRRVS